MKLLITGICGFAGSSLAECLLGRREGLTIYGIDNLMRPGSETNRRKLQELGVKFSHGDIRAASDFESYSAHREKGKPTSAQGLENLGSRSGCI